MRRTPKLDDAELSETLVTLLLPIGRLMLKGGLGIADLVRAGKEAYVRAAMSYLIPPVGCANASRLSVVTGLTRKEVATILKGIEGLVTVRRSDFKGKGRLRVIQGWKLDQRFCNKRGRPATLPLRGDRAVFRGVGEDLRRRCYSELCAKGVGANERCYPRIDLEVFAFDPPVYAPNQPSTWLIWRVCFQTSLTP